MEVLGAWHGNTEDGDAGLRHAAPALWDEVSLVAGPQQPGNGQDRGSGDTSADALVLGAPNTPCKNEAEQGCESPSHPSTSWAKFSPFSQPLAAERTNPEALRAPSGKENHAGPLHELRVWVSPRSCTGIAETITGCDQQCRAGKKYPCIIIISILSVSLETCHCPSAEGRGHHAHQTPGSLDTTSEGIPVG